jgi:hypothetical protein
LFSSLNDWLVDYCLTSCETNCCSLWAATYYFLLKRSLKSCYLCVKQ